MLVKFDNPDNGRFYYLCTHRDLFNDLVLTVIRGGKNGSRVERHYGFKDLLSIYAEIKRISKIRLSHGYELS